MSISDVYLSVQVFPDLNQVLFRISMRFLCSLKIDFTFFDSVFLALGEKGSLHQITIFLIVESLTEIFSILQKEFRKMSKIGIVIFSTIRSITLRLVSSGIVVEGFLFLFLWIKPSFPSF